MKILIGGETVEWGQDDLLDFFAQYGVAEVSGGGWGSIKGFTYLSRTGREKPWEEVSPYVFYDEDDRHFCVLPFVGTGLGERKIPDALDAIDAWLRMCDPTEGGES